MFSTEYRGANRNDRSLWGAQFGETFGEAVPMTTRPAVKAAGPTVSGNLVVDRTVHNGSLRPAWAISRPSFGQPSASVGPLQSADVLLRSELASSCPQQGRFGGVFLAMSHLPRNLTAVAWLVEDVRSRRLAL